MRVRYSIHHASEPLVVQRGTTASNTYHYYTSFDKLCHQSLYTSPCRQTDLKTMLSSYNESKTTVKENILQNLCFKELQDGTGIDYACSSWKLLPIKVGLSPFLLMDLYLILHYYSSNSLTFPDFLNPFPNFSDHLVLSFSKYRDRIE